VTSTPQTAPYGSWRSPISTEVVLSGALRLGHIGLDGDSLYWVEGRPAEQGRQVLVRRDPDGSVTDIVPGSVNVRSRVHEYGGRSYAVHDGAAWFVDFADQRLYHAEPGTDARPLTPAGELRYADMIVDPGRRRLICVHEDHTGTGEARNLLAAVPWDGGAPEPLVEGNDFYAAPRLSPRGDQLCWVAWNHPNMPWDTTELWLADIDDNGALHNKRRIAGGERESIAQPAWSPKGALHFISDQDGWWNPYRYDGDGRVTRLAQVEAEFCPPAWLLGYQSYGFLDEERLACAVCTQGTWSLRILDTSSGNLAEVPTPYTELGDYLCVRNGIVFVTAGSPAHPRSIVAIDTRDGSMENLRRSSDVAVDAAFISTPEAVEFPTENGLTSHGFFYPPRNPDVQAPAGERPPLLVHSHGGPTAAASTTLDLEIQYWTSRGVGVLDVDYGGSTGYGRPYRERLDGQWGVVDVDDCVNGARFLCERGDADARRLMIAGGSAGGYTTLCALTFRDTFSAGASHFGVGDLELLRKDTHKFESRYEDRLVAPYPAQRDLWYERSPIHFVERLSCPVILFQGLEDEVVPPNQAETMFAALVAKGVPCAYLAFEGEQHGFRRAENIRRTLEAELYFYSRVFGFDVADDIEPVTIANL
jgi:dipeptidyl aminopeptidase/acylaminoacyl peptidase